MSVSSKPELKDLVSSLKQLVKWEEMALQLPGINDQSIIEKIKREEKSVDSMKHTLFREWLRLYPKATWEDVFFALKKSDENDLAETIDQLYCKVSKHALESSTKHTMSIEEEIVRDLKNMQKVFAGLAANVEITFGKLVQSNDVDLCELSTRLRYEEGFYDIDDITEVQTTKQLFNKVSKCCTFLDCELLETITELLPDNSGLKSDVKAHIMRVHTFKQNALISNLQDKIGSLIDQSHNAEKSTLIVFKLQNSWGNKAIGVFETLLKTLFPKLSHKMNWYDIRPGSVCIMFYAHKHIFEALATSSKQKLVFMRLVGVFDLQIGDAIVMKEDENRNYSFDGAFLEASLTCNFDALKFFLAVGVNVDYRNEAGKTALLIASEQGHTEIVKYLVPKKADVNACDEESNSALIFATESYNVEIVQTLSNAKANPNHQRNDGNTSLHIACYKEYEDLAIMLFKFGADPLIKNHKLDTPFLSSVRSNMLKFVKLILPNLPLSELPLALLVASRLGYTDMITNLLQYIDCGSKDIHFFCASGDLAQAAECIVLFRENANSPLILGITPLMIASSCGHVEVVDCLIQAEADFNSTDQDGFSPLAYAITGSKSIAIVECLLQAGANPCISVRDVNLLQMAKEKCKSDMTHLLLQYMALQLYNMFSSVVDKIQRDLSNDIKQNKVTLQEIVSSLQKDTEFRNINGITRASNCVELFSCLKPHYNFLSWKIVSFLSDHLKEEGYFTFVEIFEEAVKLANFSSVLLLVPHEEEENSHPSSYSELTLTFERAWDRKSLFNLRKLNAFLFSSTACLMSHSTINYLSNKIVVKYRIPKSSKLLERIKSIVLRKQTSVAVMGIMKIAIDSKSILNIEQNHLFTFESAIFRAINHFKALASHEQIELLKFLFKLGEVDPNIVIDTWTPLHLCVSSGNLQAVNVLLQNGASPRVCDNERGFTPLMLAAHLGYLEIVQALANVDHTTINQTDTTNRTAVMYAIWEGHVEIVHLLLQKGTQPNITSNEGETALMVASQEGYAEIVHLLLEAGADPNVIHESGHTALMLASISGYSEVVKLLLANQANYSHSVSRKGILFNAFRYACHRGNKETIDVFLNDAKLSPTSLSLGWYIACLYNKLNLIEYLVHSLSNVSSNLRDLVVACVNGNTSFIMGSLPQFSQDIEFVHGVTLLMIACSCGQSSIVKVLVDAGAKVHKVDEFGFTAKTYCKENSPILEILMNPQDEVTVQKRFNKEVIFQDVLPLHNKGVVSSEMLHQYLSSVTEVHVY